MEMQNMRQQQPIPFDYNNLPQGNNNYYNGGGDDIPKGSYFQNNTSGQYQQAHQQQQQQSQPGQQNQPMKRLLSPHNFNPNAFGNEHVNNDLNKFVRNQLMSRGISMARGNTPGQIKQQEQEKKKLLLENIQSQINLTNSTKRQDYLRKKEEDEQYLKDMVNCFPYGRGGGGAPIRDKNGNIITTRRCLISDPKYNLVSINVDDDYNDVWGKDKRYGLVNFKYKPLVSRMGNNDNGNPNPIGGMMPRNYSARPLEMGGNWNQTIPMGNPMSMGNDYNNYYPQQLQQQGPMYNNNNDYGGNGGNNDMFYNQPPMNNNFQRTMRNPSNSFNMSYNQYDGNMNEPQFINNNNRPYSTMNHNQQQQQQQQMQMQEMPMYEKGNGTLTNIEKADINLSYDNYEVDEEKRQKQKDVYRNELQIQMQEKKRQEQLDKAKREEQERKDDEKVRRDNEEIQRRLDEERNKTIKAAANTDFMNQYVIENKKSTTRKFNNDSNQQIDQANAQKSAEEAALIQFNQQEIESRMALNSEILKLRDQMQDQQLNLFNQINSLKTETQSANIQRFEALKEIESLKHELSKQRADEELRRKYVYDVIADDHSKTSHVYNQTHLPDTQIEKVILPTKRAHDVYYEEKIRHPNKIMPNPDFGELRENQFKTASKFIDIDSHKVVDGLEVYQPKIYNDDEQDDYNIANHKGYELNEDFNPLRSYYHHDDNDETTNERIVNKEDLKNRFSVDVNKSIEKNVTGLDDNHLEINQIYNKNLERLRYLNDIDNSTARNGHGYNIGYSNSNNSRGGGKGDNYNQESKTNFDDFINKLNKTCEVPDN